MAEPDKPKPSPKLTGVNNACLMLGITRSTYFNMRAAGRIGPQEIRFGAKILLRVAELDDWIEAGCPPRRQWIWKGKP